MAQRWLGVCSEAAQQRAETSVSKAQARELEAIEKQLFHLQARRFESPQSAQSALATLSGSWRYHQMATTELIEHKRYAAALSTCTANLLTRRACCTDGLAEYEDYSSKSRRNLARMDSVPARKRRIHG
jgi:hypothetical protein